jgi:aryl-alcohol dehydrogenase-like predicted oxidoreductase
VARMRPWIMGPTSMEHLRDNVSAVDLELSADDIRELDGIANG